MPRTMRLPASKPRNPVVHALARLGRNGSGKHKRYKRQRDQARKELDAQLREQ